MAERLLTYSAFATMSRDPAIMTVFKLAHDFKRVVDLEPVLGLRAIFEGWCVHRISEETYRRLRHISRCPVCGTKQLGFGCCDACWNKEVKS